MTTVNQSFKQTNKQSRKNLPINQKLRLQSNPKQSFKQTTSKRTTTLEHRTIKINNKLINQSKGMTTVEPQTINQSIKKYN